MGQKHFSRVMLFFFFFFYCWLPLLRPFFTKFNCMFQPVVANKSSNIRRPKEVAVLDEATFGQFPL